jgi:hypothetical protein
MTTLTIGSLERRLLQTLGEEVAVEPVHQWPQQSVELCLDLLRRMHANTARVRQGLEELLANGVEARSFARDTGPLLAIVDEQIASVRALVERLSPARDAASETLEVELRRLQQETQALRDLLAEALSRASEPPRPVDAERVRAAEEAHARGETKPFSRR